MLLSSDATIAAQLPTLPDLLRDWAIFSVVKELIDVITQGVQLLQSGEGRMGLVIPVFSAVCDVAEKLQRGLGGAHKQKMGLVVAKLKARLQQYVEIPWVVAATVLHPLLLVPMEDPQKRVLSPMKQLVDGFMAKSLLKQQLRDTASRYLRGTGAAGADAELLFYLGRQGIYKTDEEETLWAATFTSPQEVWW